MSNNTNNALQVSSYEGVISLCRYSFVGEASEVFDYIHYWIDAA